MRSCFVYFITEGNLESGNFFWHKVNRPELGRVLQGAA